MMDRLRKFNADIVKTVHQDGTVSFIDSRAMGGNLSEMPKGYFYSIRFVGTVAVSNYDLQNE